MMYHTWRDYCRMRKETGHNDLSDWKFYFAYGMNLHERSMAVRCKGAIKVQGLMKPDFALVFRNVADMVKCEGATIHGGIWLMNKNHERSLDALEGVDLRKPANGWYLKKYFLLHLIGIEQPVPCLYYQMNAKKHRYGVMPPSEGYYNTLKQGYIDFNLPEEALIEAKDAAWDNKKVTPMLRTHRKLRGGKSVIIDLKLNGEKTDVS